MIEGDTIVGVRGEMNAVVESLVSQDFVGEAEVNKRESVRGYIGAVWFSFFLTSFSENLAVGRI
jgi:hypothetical protein